LKNKIVNIYSKIVFLSKLTINSINNNPKINLKMTLQAIIDQINNSASIQQFAIDNLLKIAVSEDGRYILNYSEAILGTPKSWVSHYCRALTLAGTPNNYYIVAKSFDRFYNIGEKPEYLADCDNIDFSQPFEVQFKYDGSLILAYLYQGKVCINTRGSFASSDVTSIEPGLTWQKLFEKAKKSAINIRSGETHIYELCSPYNQAVEYYEETFANRIGIVKTDGTEIKDCFEGFGYECKSFEDVQNKLNMLKPTQEGFVITQWDEANQRYKRKKLKTKTWTELSHIADSGLSSVSKLWNCVFSGDKDEVSSVFPYLKPKLEEMWTKYQLTIKEVEAEYNNYKHIQDQKEFAIAIKGSKFQGILFSIRAKKTTAILGTQKFLIK
jgi:hypothetical protein